MDASADAQTEGGANSEQRVDESCSTKSAPGAGVSGHPDGFDTEWLCSVLKMDVMHATWHEVPQGLSPAALHFVDAHMRDGKELKLALKTVRVDRWQTSSRLGLPREAFFYAELAPRLQSESALPRVYFSRGDMDTGHKVILMERLLDAVPTGAFFGPGNPNNWASKEELEAMCRGNPSGAEISAVAFAAYARLHARFWLDRELLQLRWLRGAAWMLGTEKESWLEAQRMAQDAWVELCAQRSLGESPLEWDAHLVACLEASFAKVSWEAYQAQATDVCWTVVHGDCHPHNAMWTRQRTAEAALCLIDFEMVGIGSGAQELGQYLISHMEPRARRACERELVSGYHAELTSALRARGLEREADAYTDQACWQEYVTGGACRWAWFAAYLGTACPPTVAQYFLDQLAAFLHDHVPSPEAMDMPRV